MEIIKTMTDKINEELANILETIDEIRNHSLEAEKEDLSKVEF